MLVRAFLSTWILIHSVVCETSDDDALLRTSINTNPATANATSVLPTVTFTPTLIYQENVAGETPHTFTISQTESTAQPSQTVYHALAAALVRADHVSYTVTFNANDRVEALCWYPVSGYYGDLTRYLFYMTIAFALLARTHEWLIIGALATSLTYSAAVAVHACVMVWSGSSAANTDVYAALGILSLSGALVVPLLNWSRTVKDLGKDREENSVGRTIIIYWGCLVFLGFLSLFGGLLWAGFTESGDREIFLLNALSSQSNITCTPSSGIMDLTAGQKQGWSSLFITDDFVDANGCTNPCKGVMNDNGREAWTILRNPDELVPLNGAQVDIFGGERNLTTKQQYSFYVFAFGLVLGTLSLAWVIAQGITVVFFGRRNPTEVRNVIYVKLAKLFSKREESSKTAEDDTIEMNVEWHPEMHRVPSFFAKSVAIMFYLWTWSASIVSAILAIGAIVATEFIMHRVPQSDENYQIDQWAAWADTALVLFVAFAYRFQGVTEDIFVRAANGTVGLIYRCFHRGKPHRSLRAPNQPSAREKNRNLIWNTVKESISKRTVGYWRSFSERTRNEWEDNKSFLRDAWNTAKDNQGLGHLRRRRNIGAEEQTFPEKWQEKHDAWLEIDDFIKAVKEFDAEHKAKYGKGYLWQPRVTAEAPLREQFDTQLLKDLFKRTRQPNIHGQVFAVRPTDNTGKHAAVDEEAAHKPEPMVQAMSIDEHPAFRGPPSSTPTTALATPLEQTSTASQQRAAQNDAALPSQPMQPVKRQSTAPVSRYSSVHQDRPATTLQHAATIQGDHPWFPRPQGSRPALARLPVAPSSASLSPSSAATPPPKQSSTITASKVPTSPTIQEEEGDKAPSSVPAGAATTATATTTTAGSAPSLEEPNQRWSESTIQKGEQARPSLSLLSLNLSSDTDSQSENPDYATASSRHFVTPAAVSVAGTSSSSEPTRRPTVKHFATPASTEYAPSEHDEMPRLG